MNITFENKTVVITGASGGIGSSMSKFFAKDGANVAICGTTQEKVDALAAELVAAGGKAKGYAFDITDKAQVFAAMDNIYNDFGSIDVLVNNAGRNVNAQSRTSIENFGDEWWDLIIKVDLEGVYQCSKAALRYMKEGSNIINISSIVGLIPLRNQCAFAAAKSGVNNLTKAMAIELAEKGIRVNAICPGTISIHATNKLWTNDERKKALLSHIPMGRQGSPDEIASVCEFLASDYASYTTGVVMAVDGGWTCGGFARDF